MSETFHIEATVPACCELTAFRLHDLPRVHEHLSVEPGAVSGDAEGRKHLHFSPGRWLTVCPSAASAPAGTPAALTVVDVSGKWSLLRLTGPDAENVLRFQLAVDAVFNGRGCAAVTVFDCPAVIERHSTGFDVLTHASYSEHLRDALANAHRSLQLTTLSETR